MNDRECVELLQWALPRLGLRWRGFKNLRRQVCRRIAGRVTELGLPDLASYRRRLEEDPDELLQLDALCFITISRFYRDRRTFDMLREPLIPSLAEAALARGERVLRAWSAGCASGEEPYTLAILWRLELADRFPALGLEILATDFDRTVLARAERGCYEPSSLAELPVELEEVAFERIDDLACLRAPFRDFVTFELQDVRHFTPEPPLHLVFCRNVAFTYFDEAAQRDFAARVAERLVPSGLLIVGGHEAVPCDGPDARFERSAASPHVYVRVR
jgi:chemotaxis protein methyltransferase CheR